MSSSAPRHTLTEEHADLLREVEARRERVLAAIAARQWPQAEIEALLGYLRYELLDQAVNEERLLYPLTRAGLPDQQIRRLSAEHAGLRDCTDAVAAAAQAEGAHRSPEQLVATLDELHHRLHRHLREEQQVLSAATVPGIEDLRRPYRSHDWFSLTEGPTVDVDQLPRAFDVAAIMDRLTRMRPAERVELISHEPLDRVQRVMARRGMTADYGWAYLDRGPTRWRAAVTRRPPD